MYSNELVDQLVDLVDSKEAAERTVAEIESKDLMAVSSELRKRAIYFLRRDAGLALAIADLILNIGDWRAAPNLRALGLQTKAIALTLSQREFEAALELFAESEAIYEAYDNELDIAVGQVSRIWALACLQRYDEAFAAGEKTMEVLSRHRDYLSVAALSNNLAAIYGRRGQDQEALERILQVEDAYTA